MEHDFEQRTSSISQEHCSSTNRGFLASLKMVVMIRISGYQKPSKNYPEATEISHVSFCEKAKSAWYNVQVIVWLPHERSAFWAN